MSTLGLAFRTFFRLFSDAPFAERVKALFAQDGPPAITETAAVTAKRSAALTLLSALQREARFVDFVMEPLDGYDDAQVGAAARDVHRDLASVVQRIFAPEPLAEEPEGASLRLDPGFDAARYHLTGDVSGEPPYSGTLRHHGWVASRCEMPAWTGEEGAAKVVSPAEVEVGS